MNDSFTLQEIANWQLYNDKSKVDLPSIQRGFVWKPKQVEDLWDSLLRGYPIGSFLFSNSGDKLYLMDGQQRSTSIFLGHFNPYSQIDETKAWAIKGELPVLWIDIKPDTLTNASKYLFRLTTRSHPWGYQASNNDSKLSVSDRRKAFDLFRKHPNNNGGYTLFKNSSVFPFDNNYPIPLCFFIESNSVNDVISKIELYIPEYFSTKRGGFKNKTEFIELLKADLNQELHIIFNDIKRTCTIQIKSNIIEDRVLIEENDIENPTLFARINSAGSTLTGDDLIYSIYKSIFPDAKNLIENVGVNFILPTQVLSLVSRIVSSELDSNNFVKKLNVRDFQRKIKNDDFKRRLKQLVQTKEIENLFEKSISIFSCKDNALFNGEIPPIILKQFIKRNQELYLFFLYWLHSHADKILDDHLKIKIVAKLICFAWFGFDNLTRLWSEKVTNEGFWDEPLNELIWWNGSNGIHFLIPPDLLRKYYEQDEILNLFKENKEHKWGLMPNGVGNEIMMYFQGVKNEEFDLTKSNEFFWKFIGKVRYNKQMILFAQRDYINSTFKDFNQLDEIEDTNVPWDWDHIYPSEWVYRKKYCNQSIKDWNNSNGNFRAISLEHNRSRSNQQSPKDISNDDERKYSLINDNDWEYWKNIEYRIWDDKVHNHFKAVTTRMINIYEKFWNDFKIKDLIKIE
jgi:hypothetical protein